MNVRVKLLQTLREEMKRRGNKMRTEERRIKMFVQHHLTLDSAEHRNSRDSCSRRSKDRRTFSIPSLSERKELRNISGELWLGSLVMPDAKFYERCPPPLFHPSWRRRPAPFSTVVFLPYELSFFFFTFALLPFILSLSCHFSRSSGVSIVNPAIVWPSRMRARVRARTNPARKGEGRNLGAESNVPREQKESAGTDWCPCRPGIVLGL